MGTEAKDSALEEELYKPFVIDINFEIQSFNYSNNSILVTSEVALNVISIYKIESPVSYLKNWDISRHYASDSRSDYKNRKTFTVSFDPYIANSNIRGWTSLNQDIHLNPLEYDLDLVKRHEIAHNLFPDVKYEDEITRLGMTLNMDDFNLVWT